MQQTKCPNKQQKTIVWRTSGKQAASGHVLQLKNDLKNGERLV